MARRKEFDWQSLGEPGRKRWPYLPNTEAAKEYALWQWMFLVDYSRLAVCHGSRLGLLYCSLN